MVFPNPVAEQLTVQTSTRLRPEQLRISNALGQVVPPQPVPGPEGTVRLETSQWAPGVYVLRVLSGPLQGQRVKVVK
jgi:hypothetical protein